MNATRSIALAIAACGLLATANAQADDAQSAPGGNGSNASTASAAASGAPVTDSRRDASERPASNESTASAPAAGEAAGRQAAPASATAAAASPEASSGDGPAKADPLAASVDDGQLGTSRGGAELQSPVNLNLNQNNSTGSVSGNVATNLTTGTNNISDSAFSNSAGVPVVIQNTGNNVLIQNSTILNLQLSAPK